MKTRMETPIEKRKTFTKTEVRLILKDIRDFVGGVDREIDDYIAEIMNDL